MSEIPVNQAALVAAADKLEELVPKLLPAANDLLSIFAPGRRLELAGDDAIRIAPMGTKGP